ncbi:hypothetical protein ACLBVT_02995 [Pseudomonas aeruginosa]|uniref:hypothetical protein n=1 Tax=Pseudomonas aeruginosa TaxID=287 RepID=UPI0007072AEF|nr:hypothetical protein [Pseudomonas aeruginosa]ELK4824880.1 hypothetical protein [Pseudomonas aeruginosa]ELT6452104.1 hypothetical protein [Pseudomonas aeruginosa]KQJ76991.1 hypothetical protein AN446_15135 [Pseudomonas aeruginosa]MBG5722683.1 hypothetical protein [Pseudomonas aeruginosa]MBG6367791.1 hypothetical protein [Pseudomonas aeruginosa]
MSELQRYRATVGNKASDRREWVYLCVDVDEVISDAMQQAREAKLFKVSLAEAVDKIVTLEAEAQALREEVAERRARVVVVPERKSGQSTIPGLHMNRGWNACLDELARLNGKVVSEADIFASVQAVRDRYPVVVFPSDGASVDCKSAAMARVVCDAVMKELSTLLASSEES